MLAIMASLAMAANMCVNVVHGSVRYPLEWFCRFFEGGGPCAHVAISSICIYVFRLYLHNKEIDMSVRSSVGSVCVYGMQDDK